MYTWTVELTMRDGSRDAVPFVTEYAAQNYVALIPFMQSAGHPDFIDITGAKVKPIVEGDSNE